jgi:hypothetical protein
MGTISTTGNSVFRDYVTDGVPGSGANSPVKADIRSLFGVVDTAVAAVSAAQRIRLAVATTFYVDGTLGNDANDGLAAGSGHAWLSIQHGIDMICNNYDINRQNVVLQVADGTYTTTSTPFSLYPVTGWGTQGGHSELCIRGNLTTPANCLISAGTNCFSMVSLITPWRIEGFKFTATGEAISADGRSFVYVGKNDFGACGVAHMGASYGSAIEIVAPYTISGSAPSHLNAFHMSHILNTGVLVTLVGTPAFSTAYAVANEMSCMDVQLMTFSGSATGQRYAANLNSLITSGGGGATFLPGSVGGTNDASSVYV